MKVLGGSMILSQKNKSLFNDLVEGSSILGLYILIVTEFASFFYLFCRL